MAPNLPHMLQLREIKYGAKSSAEERSAVGRRLLEAGRLAEALDLFLLAGDEAGIEEMRGRAVREGRPLLLIMLRRGGKHTVSRAEWKAAGDAAYAAQRWREAFRCYSEAADEAGLAQVQAQLPDYEVYQPPGK